MRAALFLTCLDDTLFPGVGKAVVTLLERLGVAVDYPAGQTCCGQMHFNSGYRAACMPLVRNFADTFGGTFSVKNPDVSSAMGSDKADNVLATGAHVLTSVDTSCLMHIGGLLSRRGSGIQVKHLAEILAAT
jgi:Fe-S oxidoreductase